MNDDFIKRNSNEREQTQRSKHNSRGEKINNYQKKLDAILASIAAQSSVSQSADARGAGQNFSAEPSISQRADAQNVSTAPAKKPSLLLHACCAPCSSYVLEYLAPYFAITIYYYNPNIFPPQEYARRLSELERFLPRFPPAVDNSVALVQADYEPREFDDALGVSENPALAEEAERGERCRRCYELRMKRAYQYAARHGFDWFTTTLSISPFKDAEKINKIGKALEEAVRAGASENDKAPRFLTSDFKKRNGFKRSLELSREYELYRQQYCGCKYSMRNSATR